MCCVCIFCVVCAHECICLCVREKYLYTCMIVHAYKCRHIHVCSLGYLGLQKLAATQKNHWVSEMMMEVGIDGRHL